MADWSASNANLIINLKKMSPKKSFCSIGPAAEKSHGEGHFSNNPLSLEDQEWLKFLRKFLSDKFILRREISLQEGGDDDDSDLGQPRREGAAEKM